MIIWFCVRRETNSEDFMKYLHDIWTRILKHDTLAQTVWWSINTHKFVRLRMPPSSVGIVPVSWLVYAMLCSHALHVGKVSPNHIKRKHKYHAGWQHGEWKRYTQWQQARTKTWRRHVDGQQPSSIRCANRASECSQYFKCQEYRIVLPIQSLWRWTICTEGLCKSKPHNVRRLVRVPMELWSGPESWLLFNILRVDEVACHPCQ